MRSLVVVPTYQEAENVGRFLEAVRAASPESDILVVDDNSPDGTGALAETAAAALGQITVLHRPAKEGLGAAYRQAFAWALEHDAEIVIQMDCDFSHDPATIPALIARILDGADSAVGSRYVPGGSTPNWPAHRQLLSRYGNRYTAAVLGLGIRDATSGFRAYRADALRRIDVATTRSNGYAFMSELALRMVGQKMRIDEVPITFVDRTFGSSKMSARIISESMVLVTAWGVSRAIRQGALKHRLRQLHRSWWWVAAAAGVALGLRLGWVVWVAREPQGLVDPVRYLGYARAIRSGHGMIDQFWGYPTAYYPPGYPWFLGIVAIVGRPFTSDLPLLIGVVQAVLGAVTVVLGAVLARRLAGPRAAIAAAWGLALYPNLIFHTGAILGETLFNTLFLGFLVAMVGLRPRAEPKLTQVVVAGLLLGLAVMVRPISLAVLPVAGCYWWWSTHRGSVVFRSSAVLVGMVLLCIVPWTVRNEIRMHRFVPISTNTGDNLCIGHGRNTSGAFTLRLDCATKASLRTGGPAGEVAADKEKTRIALRSIADAPGREPWLLWRRTYFIWVRDGDHDGLLAVESYRLDRWMAPRTEARLARVADVAYWLLLAVAAIGVLRLARRRMPEDLLLLGSALMTALVPLAFFGDSRFKVPVIPLLIVMAASVAGAVEVRRSAASS